MQQFGRMSARRLLIIPLALISLLVAFAFADDAGVVLLWPDKSKPTLKLTFSHFRNEGSEVGQATFTADVLIENLSSTPMPRASLEVRLLDKDHVRIGTGLLAVNDLSPGESAKALFQSASIGMPSALAISAINKGGIPTSSKTVPMRVISEPVGASLKVDGKDMGFTPLTINFGVGNHDLELQKDGYALTTTPFDVAPDEAPGGSIKVTLGGLSNDVIALRDGTSLTGDILSMSLESITIRVDGKDQKVDRNLVSKMFLVERIIQPASAKSVKPTSTTSPSPHQ
ncbi:MAG: PEGA domain-containing protein [Terriglobales bacterium]